MPHPKQIPLTPQTDEANFPRHAPHAPRGFSGADFPKMLTRPFTKEDREEWRTKHVRIDVASRQEYFEERCPKIGDPVPVLTNLAMVDEGLANTAGEPVIVDDPGHEERVLEMLGMTADELCQPIAAVSLPMAAANNRVVAGLEASNEALIAQNKKLEAMLEKMAGKKAVKAAAPKRRGKGKTAKVKISAKAEREMTLEELAELDE